MHYTSRDVYEYISRQTNDPIIQWKTCRISGTEFPIFQSDIDFYTKISPTFAGQKFSIPTPTICPEERQRRRLLWRNRAKLYKNTCAQSGDSIISIYSPDKPYKVFRQDIRWLDGRDCMDYGQEFDFSKSFTDQFNTLILNVPKRALVKGKGSENCPYVNGVGNSRNCYYIFESFDNDDCYFSSEMSGSKESADCIGVYGCEHCFELIDCQQCYQSRYCMNSSNCTNSIGLFNCQNCENCLFCHDIQNKQYYVDNKQVSPDEYKNIVQQLGSLSRDEFKKHIRFNELILINTINVNSHNSYGNNILNASNIVFGYRANNVRDIKYGSGINKGAHDCMDVDVCLNDSHMTLEGGIINKNSFNILFTYDCRDNCDSLLYCLECKNCQHCFGCTGMEGKSYCILNTQYSKEDYDLTVAKILSHMQTTGERGEFLHPSLSPFGYNETVAHEYFPMHCVGTHIYASDSQEKDYSQYGIKRSDYSADPVIPTGTQTLQGDQIPRDISMVNDDILQRVFVCEVSARPFKLQKAELEFYRKHSIPLPRKHPDVRYEEKLSMRPGRTLHLDHCDKCDKEMLSVYAPKEVPLGDAKEYEGKVYCESCHQQEVYR